MNAGKARGPDDKPWVALGLSKSTYYRRLAKQGQPEGATPRRDSPTQDAVDRALARQARIQLEQTLQGKREDEAVALTGTVDLLRAVAATLRKSGC
jgi:hypothetical protein